MARTSDLAQHYSLQEPEYLESKAIPWNMEYKPSVGEPPFLQSTARLQSAASNRSVHAAGSCAADAACTRNAGSRYAPQYV
jgi:hypothetical protein